MPKGTARTQRATLQERVSNISQMRSDRGGVCLPFPALSDLRLSVLLGARMDFRAGNTPGGMELLR
jgi:hypothetical protein